MFEVEFTLPVNKPRIKNEHKKIMLVKRFFCRRGVYFKDYDWVLLYKALFDFKLLFRFKYNMASKTLTADYIPRHYRWFNQMRFFQFYTKLFQRGKWFELPLKYLFIYINRAKRYCYNGLIKQKKKKIQDA